LWAREAARSMFEYCTEVLHLSEAEAYLRIAVARASRKHPLLLEMLGDGRLHLSGIAKLAPHLTRTNRDEVLARAVHKSKRQIEELVAELEPQPDAVSVIRKLPAPRGHEPVLHAAAADASGQLRPGAVVVPAPSPCMAPLAVQQTQRPTIQPTAPARYKVQFTASAAFREKLERLAALVRSTNPGADLSAVLEAAVTEKLARLEARRYGRTTTPRKSVAEADTSAGCRYVPTPVRRAVDDRDGGRCRFVGSDGQQCSARHALQFHHRQNYADGGDHSPDNLQLMCSSHNLLLAERDFGQELMARYRRSGRRDPSG
jgi:hypothetical protein